MELTHLIAVFTIFEAVGCTTAAHQDTHGLRRDSHAGTSEQLHLSSSSLIRKRRFFDDDELEDVEKHLGEKIGKVCPAAKHWFDSHEGHPGNHRALGHGGGDAIHLAIRIRRLKKAIEVLCREHTTPKPHKPQTHKPRPTHHPSHSPSASVPYLGGGLLPDRIARNLEIRRYVIWPLRQWFGWPAGALASAFLLQ